MVSMERVCKLNRWGRVNSWYQWIGLSNLMDGVRVNSWYQCIRYVDLVDGVRFNS